MGFRFRHQKALCWLRSFIAFPDSGAGSGTRRTARRRSSGVGLIHRDSPDGGSYKSDLKPSADDGIQRGELHPVGPFAVGRRLRSFRFAAAGSVAWRETDNAGVWLVVGRGADPCGLTELDGGGRASAPMDRSLRKVSVATARRAVQVGGGTWERN